MRLPLALPLLLLLVACEREQVAAPTEEESAALNDADAMLNNLAENETR